MYSNAQWHQRHSFTTGFVYELPVGKGKAWRWCRLDVVPEQDIGSPSGGHAPHSGSIPARSRFPPL